MRVPERVRLIRIVASPAALDSAEWPTGAIVLRVAPDEVLAVDVPENVPQLSDPHAIELRDSGFSALWLESGEAHEFLTRSCEWELPIHRPAFAQGAVAGVPVKLWFEQDRVLILLPAPYASDLEERLA